MWLFFNPPDALWLWLRRWRFVIFVYLKMAVQGDNRLKVSALLHAGHKVSEVANLVSLAHLSTRPRSAWTMAKVLTDVQAVVERLLWIVTIRSMPCIIRNPSNGILQAVATPNRLSAAACTSVDTFAIVHALLDRIPTRLPTSLTLSTPTKKCSVQPTANHICW